MKKTLIDIGTGVVLSDAIAAVLQQRDDKGMPATVILKSGGHLPTERLYPELVIDLEMALAIPPLSDYVPEIAQAMQALQGTVTPAQAVEPGKPHRGKTKEKDGDEKEVIAPPPEKH